MRGDILVVDDEAGPRESLRMILKDTHNVRAAEGGKQALEKIEDDPPDLVLLDLRMPGMHGTEVMKAIKQQYPAVEVAIVTAYAGIESARLAVRLGAVDYLIKPYSVEEVERVVDNALRKRTQQHDARVLAQQVTRLTEDLTQQSELLEEVSDEEANVVIDRLKNLQNELNGDLDAVESLYELGENAAEVSHDVNNMLTIVLNSAEFLLQQIEQDEEMDSDDIQRWLSNIVTAAADGTTMMRRVKDYVRADVNEDPETIDVNKMVSRAVNLVEDSGAADTTDVNIELDLNPVPTIEGDEVALRNVVVNLVENSIDAIEEKEEGLVRLTTRHADENVEILVEDNGVGMSDEVKQNATEAFFTTKQEHGTGLGLSIAHKVLKKHHGQIQIDSERGHGTTVALLVPANIPDRKTHDDELQPDAEPEQTGTIVLMEDSPAMRQLIYNILTSDGYQVVSAEDGADGWQLFEETYRQQNTGPLLVISDYEMPGLTGIEVAEKIKQTDTNIPVIVVSGYSVPVSDAVDLVVDKPFGMHQLLRPVREMMQRPAAAN